MPLRANLELTVTGLIKSALYLDTLARARAAQGSAQLVTDFQHHWLLNGLTLPASREAADPTGGPSYLSELQYVRSTMHCSSQLTVNTSPQ